jgi:hypothetical protein
LKARLKAYFSIQPCNLNLFRMVSLSTLTVKMCSTIFKMSEIMNDDLGIHAFINIFANTKDRHHLEGIHHLFFNLKKNLHQNHLSNVIEWLILWFRERHEPPNLTSFIELHFSYQNAASRYISIVGYPKSLIIHINWIQLVA